MKLRLITTSLLAATPLFAQDSARSLDSTFLAAEARGFSGAVLIARNGKVLLEKGYGMANRADRIPFTPSTIVQIGSNTKDFSAVAILQLQQRGLLDVHDKLSRFFPDAPADKKDITIWQLMRHEAGFPLGLGGGDFAPMTRQALIDSAMSFRLLFAPGARQSYSNTGYSLLAAIIERVSGRTYDEYVRDNILVPAGLVHTGFLLPGFAARDLAHGYRASGEDAGTMLAKPHAPDGPWWNLRGNGGMLSTVGDMRQFYKTLFESEKLLRLDARNGMFNPDEPIGLAGSDLVNFFLYERMPRAGIEMLIASTNAAMKAPAVRSEIAPILGLPGMGDPDDGEDGGPVARAEGKPVSEAVSKLIDDFVAAINAGDKAALSRFISAHFLLTPDSPTADQRAERLAGMHSDLGILTVLRTAVVESGQVQAVVKTEREGQALLIFDVEMSDPYRIRRFGIQVGG